MCCLGIVPAVVYYYVFAPRHKVTVTMTGDKDASVIATGNTNIAKKDAAQFQQTVRG